MCLIIKDWKAWMIFLLSCAATEEDVNAFLEKRVPV